MIRRVLPVVALSLLAGCATTQPNEPEYQIGVTGARQPRSDAERAHALASQQAGPTADYDVAPRVLTARFPDYPRNLRSAGIEGRVVVGFTVEPDGSISEAAVQGTPPPQLAALALGAIRQWQFAPAMKKGLPVRVRLQQPFLFRTE